MKIIQGLDLPHDLDQDPGLDPGLALLDTLRDHAPGQSIPDPTPKAVPGLVLTAVESVQGQERGNATGLTLTRVLVHQALTEEGILTFFRSFFDHNNKKISLAFNACITYCI